MSKTTSSGKRFTHVYSDRGKPTDDNPRMRRRLGSVLDSLDYSVSEIAERKLGIQTPWSLAKNWRQILPEWQIGDVLDLITIAHHEIRRAQSADRYASLQDKAVQFLGEVSEIFIDENVHYEVDGHGGVHYRFDEEFARARAATIASLQEARYTNALDGFKRAMSELSKPAPDGKHAIRSVFAAIEGLFRLISTDSPRLTSKEVGKLGPMIQRSTSGNIAATGAATKALESFKDWIDAAHYYRHEPGSEEVAQPPLSLAIHLVSTGAAHLRWLAELDQTAAN